MLSIARALILNPKLLMLDEPSQGLAPLIVEDVFRIVAAARREGVSVLLVEQNVRAAVEIADRAYVLDDGRIVYEGDAQDVRRRREAGARTRRRQRREVGHGRVAESLLHAPVRVRPDLRRIPDLHCSREPRLIAGPAPVVRAGKRQGVSPEEARGEGCEMFRQLLTPVADSLPLSFVVAALPVVTVLVLLGVMRRPAWQSSLAGLVVGLVIAVAVWSLPASLALSSIANGAVFALWPVMWIVVNALLLYNIAVESKRFDAFRAWILNHLPNDRRVVLVVIGFCFGALLEGISGFGTPIAITASLLILVGFPALEALVLVLIFNTAPVAFGALGVPVTVLGAVTGLPATVLGSMIGRQLPFFALLLPFYVMGLYGGVRSLRALWPVLLVAGGSFALFQFLSSNYINYALTDVLASLGSLIVTLGFLQTLETGARPRIRGEGGRRPAPRAFGCRAVARLGSLAHRDRSRHLVDDVRGFQDRPTGNPMARSRQSNLDHALQ